MRVSILVCVGRVEEEGSVCVCMCAAERCAILCLCNTGSVGGKCGTGHCYDFSVCVCVFEQYCPHVWVLDFLLNVTVNLTI